MILCDVQQPIQTENISKVQLAW